MSFYATISLTESDAVWSLQTQRYSTIKEVEPDIEFFVRKRFFSFHVPTVLELLRSTPVGKSATMVLDGRTITVGCFSSHQEPSVRF